MCISEIPIIPMEYVAKAQSMQIGRAIIEKWER